MNDRRLTEEELRAWRRKRIMITLYLMLRNGPAARRLVEELSREYAETIRILSTPDAGADGGAGGDA